jgi:hypothetical protein
MKIRAAGAALATAVILAACGGTSSNSNSPSPTPSATPFVATDSHFSAVFPAKPQRQTQAINETGLNTTMTLYIATTNDEQVAVAYQKLPSPPDPAGVKAGLDGGVNGSAQNVKGTIVSRSNTTFLGQPAEDAVIQAQGTVVHERIVFIGDGLYVLEGITNSVSAKHPAYDKMLATFKTV